MEHFERNCFQTRPRQAFPKRKSKHLLKSQVSLCDLHLRRSTCSYMLSITVFHLKGTTSEVRAHVGTLFGHTGRWSVAKCSSVCTKFPRLFHHHGNNKKRFVKKIVSKKPWTSSEICKKNWWTCFLLPMRGCLCEICDCEVGNLRNVRQREVGLSHKNTLCVPSYCAGRVRGGVGTSFVRMSRTFQ